MENIIVGFFMGIFGMAYLVYGKKKLDYIFAISGLVLMIIPYFVSSWILLSIIFVLAVIAPFFF